MIKKFGHSLNISTMKLSDRKWSFLQWKINGLKLIIFMTKNQWTHFKYFNDENVAITSKCLCDEDRVVVIYKFQQQNVIGRKFQFPLMRNK